MKFLSLRNKFINKFLINGKKYNSFSIINNVLTLQTFKDKENKASFDGNVKVILDDIVIVSPNANAILNPKTKKNRYRKFFK